MYTYSRYPERVRAVEITQIDADDPKQVIDSRGDHRVLSTTKAKIGDYIVFETNLSDTRIDTTCEQWRPRAAFLKDYYMD